MTDLSLIHYYFGEREKSFLLGFGTILRAKGHSRSVLIVIDDNSISLIPHLDEEDIPTIIIKTDDKEIEVNKFILKILKDLEETVCLIVNIDILVNFDTTLLQLFLQELENLENSNELIFTSETHFKELEEIADYVSRVNEI